MQLSEHALEQALSRGISEADLSNTHKSGSRWRCNHNTEIHYARLNCMFVVLHGADDWVITAYRTDN